MSIVSESFVMRLARRLGGEKIAWALRRLYCPVTKNALVLEVGSGGNPYARANVLLDAYEDTRERHWAPLVSDRPTVLGFVENLPFQDKAFDFVIASHVLEHSADPVRFLAELQRVAKAGYIETPDAFMERVNPYRDHRLEVTVRNNRLVIRKKTDWKADPDLVELYEYRAKPWVSRTLIPSYPFDFHVRFYWEDNIQYDLVNATVDAQWEAPRGSVVTAPSGLRYRVQQRVLGVLRSMQSQRKRNKQIDLLPLMRCTVCFSSTLERKGDVLVCGKCACSYEMRSGIPVMKPGETGRQSV